MAVSITSVGLIVGVNMEPLQDANITATKNNGIIVLQMIFTFLLPIYFERSAQLSLDQTAGCIRRHLGG
jgi:hypothetical protein